MEATTTRRPADRSVWLSAQDADVGAFRRQIELRTDPADWPLAAKVEQNVLIYDGDAVRAAALDPTERRALMAEWADAFGTGPGVLAIAGAFADTGTIDRATEIFTGIIDEQRRSQSGGGDHFAKPGANDRIWNALEKHCLVDPENFALYFGNEAIALASEAWLGAGYQMTAQINRVNPGGTAQTAHRDYHLGFMSGEQIAGYPAHVHRLSPMLTLQGAVAHCDMPIESGPTMLLPYSQLFLEGYLVFERPEFQAYFAEHHVQLPLRKGDVVFFNPALMHAAGTNRSRDIYRMANLLQVSSAFGRAMESVDRTRMCLALYGPLRRLVAAARLTPAGAERAIAASAEGYPFPTNLDRDPPVGGLAPKSQAALMREALAADLDEQTFAAEVRRQAERRLP